jgi:hypothetical protein
MDAVPGQEAEKREDVRFPVRHTIAGQAAPVRVTRWDQRMGDRWSAPRKRGSGPPCAP